MEQHKLSPLTWRLPFLLESVTYDFSRYKYSFVAEVGAGYGYFLIKFPT
jgi:hypothetical protein